MASTVNTTTSTAGTRMPFQRKSFYHNGRYWVFYSPGDDFVYRTSLNNIAWSAPTTLHVGAHAAWSSVVFDGTYVHYTCCTWTAWTPLYYKRGIPNSDGTISWSADEQIAVAGSADKYSDPTVAIDSDGYPFISYMRGDRCFCTKSSTNDGVWTADWDVLIKPSAGTYVFSSIVPLSSTRMYIVYGEANAVLYGELWNGAAWSGEENVSTSSVEDILGGFCVTSIDDDVYVAFLKDATNDIVYLKRTYGVGWGAEETVEAGATATSTPVISHHGSKIYVLWADSPTADHIYYRARNGAWAARVDWLDESGEGLKRNDALSCYRESFAGALCAIWLTTPASPYNVRHDCLLGPSPPPGLENKSANMAAKMVGAGLI